MKPLTINGFEVTDKGAEVLGKWAEHGILTDYIDYLSDMQDLFCRLLEHQPQHDPKIKESLQQIVSIKDDLKKLRT